MGYERYKTLKFARPAPGVLEILMGEEGKLATGGSLQGELYAS